jgi:hypothetical protein
VAVACAACGAHSGPSVDASRAKELVLQPSDLPVGFVSIGSGRSNPLAQAGGGANPKRFGRVGGWYADYRRPPNTTTSGPLVVQSTVDVFANVDGARKEFAAADARFGSGARVRVARLGDESFAVELVGPGTPGVRIDTFIWRQANVTSNLAVTGTRRKLTLAQSFAIARRQAARIGAAAAARQGLGPEARRAVLLLQDFQ